MRARWWKESLKSFKRTVFGVSCFLRTSGFPMIVRLSPRNAVSGSRAYFPCPTHPRNRKPKAVVTRTFSPRSPGPHHPRASRIVSPDYPATVTPAKLANWEKVLIALSRHSTRTGRSYFNAGHHHPSPSPLAPQIDTHNDKQRPADCPSKRLSYLAEISTPSRLSAQWSVACRLASGKNEAALPSSPSALAAHTYMVAGPFYD